MDRRIDKHFIFTEIIVYEFLKTDLVGINPYCVG